MASRIKTFADVDTSSDFSGDEDEPGSKSGVSLTFRTEQTERKSQGAASQKAGRAITESEGSIMFDSDSDEDVPAPVPVAAPPSQAAAPAKVASPLAGLVFAGPAKAQSMTPQQGPVVRQHTEAPPTPATHTPVQAAPVAVVPEALSKPTEVRTPVSQASASSPQPRRPEVTTVERPVPQSQTAVPQPRRSPPSQPAAVPSGHERSDDEDQDSFAEAVLPHPVTSTRSAQEPRSAPRSTRMPAMMQARTPTRESAVAPDLPSDVSELLVRAQLRLEEKKRTTGLTGSATPRHRLPSPRVPPHGVSAGSPPRASSAVRGSLVPNLGEAARRSVAPVAAGSSSALTVVGTPRAGLQDDAKMRRLAQENARLVEEVNYLNRENQKLRSASGTADTAEAMRLQLTVDMLRRELQAREVDRQEERDAHRSQLDTMQEQIQQLVDQTEGYASSAEQYKEMYQEKLRELEDAKTRFQAVVDQVQAVEQRQRVLEQQGKDRVEAERDRADRAVATVQDVKEQRDHIQHLNDQLQGELQRSADERRQLKASLDKAHADVRHAREESGRLLDAARDELDHLRQTMGEKEKLHAAQLREEQRQQTTVQQRLVQLQADHDEEVARLQRSADVAREDGKRLLREERERRLQVENELRRVTTTGWQSPGGSTLASRDATDVYTATMAAELERRLKECKLDLDNERRARTEVESQHAQLVDELEQSQQALAYYQEEVASLAARLAQSEDLRDASDAQRALLQSALDDLISHDENQAQHIANLEAAADEHSLRGHTSEAGTRRGDPSAYYDAEQLSAENERLNSECERLADERDQLLEDNGRIAEELLKWKDEMRRFASSYTRASPSSTKRSHAS